MKIKLISIPKERKYKKIKFFKNFNDFKKDITTSKQNKREKPIKKKKTYKCEVKCSNCNYGYPYDDGFDVPKGMKEKDWSAQQECPTCGCKGVLYFYGGCSDNN